MTRFKMLGASVPLPGSAAADGAETPNACASLAQAGHFAATTITAAREVPADALPGVPAHCEVTGTIAPVAGSRIVEASARLFLAPGVYHCAGGPGADRFDMLGALESWVEQGEAPAAIPATRADGRFSRPLCPYPALPRYRGIGDPSVAASFVCR